MNFKVFFIFYLFGIISYSQTTYTYIIDQKINDIESATDLILSEFDWCQLTGVTTDGGGVFKIWTRENKIIKIYQEIGFSYGRLRTTVYLENEQPIQIIEIEDNFGHKNHDINYQKLDEVFKSVSFIFNYDEDEGKLIQKGKRNYSEMSCSNFELIEPLLELTKKALSE